MMLKAIETTATVTGDGSIIVDIDELAPGQYRVIILIEEEQRATARPPLALPVHDVGPWPEGLSLRREDLYDDRV